IRRIIKKVLDLGMCKILYEDFMKLFDSSKIISYQPADPKGLILWDIKYNDNIKFIEDLKSKARMNNFFLKKEIKFGHKHYLFRALQHNDFSQ
ncbi:MAG: hypothetical protein KAT57_10725, partial [Candidatus Lokiarchaeota archaeon]|nr:hypothetical protein [Candidatus Lokiarchaeota archaeon]